MDAVHDAESGLPVREVALRLLGRRDGRIGGHRYREIVHYVLMIVIGCKRQHMSDRSSDALNARIGIVDPVSVIGRAEQIINFLGDSEFDPVLFDLRVDEQSWAARSSEKRAKRTCNFNIKDQKGSLYCRKK